MFSNLLHIISVNKRLSSIILLINTFVWLSWISLILREVVTMAAFPDNEVFIVWSVNFCGAFVSILVGALLAAKFNQTHFLLFWILLGVTASLIPIFMDITTINNVIIMSCLFSVSIGLGLPVCMANFAKYTVVENRARLSGVMFLLIMILEAFLFTLITQNIITSLLASTCWRGFALACLFAKDSNEKRRFCVSFISIVKEHSFISYIVPWTMFSLVNYLSASIGINVHGEEFMYYLMFTENILIGIFAIIGGFLCDTIGRKRITICGFILLGLGYAILGIYPLSMICLLFYTVVDGIAWGIFYVVFFFTIWGDLAHEKSSETYYALGSLPYLLSNFLRLTIGPVIANIISAYAIFSFAAFFLFLAVIPLMFAPETLPEKKLRERELRQYIEKAKKIKEKFT